MSDKERYQIHTKENGERILYVSEEDKIEIDKRRLQHRIIRLTSVLWCIYVIFALYVETKSNRLTESQPEQINAYDYEEYEEKYELKLPFRFKDDFPNANKLRIKTHFANSFQPCKNDTKYLIAIDSLNRNFKLREKIRQDYQTFMPMNNTEYRIFVGQFGRNAKNYSKGNLTEELSHYNDTILVGVYDDKWNWTWKALAVLSWANLNCQSAEYLIHIRDGMDFDTNKVGNLSDINCGTAQFNATVKREGKWMVPLDEYPEALYPAFCSGGGYILSRNATVELLEEAKKTDNFRFPDVHITGILRMRLKMDDPTALPRGTFVHKPRNDKPKNTL